MSLIQKMIFGILGTLMIIGVFLSSPIIIGNVIGGNGLVNYSGFVLILLGLIGFIFLSNKHIGEIVEQGVFDFAKTKKQKLQDKVSIDPTAELGSKENPDYDPEIEALYYQHYWNNVARIACVRFGELQKGERISDKEIKKRLSDLRKAHYDVPAYSHMNRQELWDTLKDIRKDVYNEIKTNYPDIYEKIETINQKQIDNKNN